MKVLQPDRRQLTDGLSCRATKNVGSRFAAEYLTIGHCSAAKQSPNYLPFAAETTKSLKPPVQKVARPGISEQLACLNQRRIGNLYLILPSDEPSFFAPLSATVLFKVPDKSCSHAIRSKNI
jgi:hypothetical protein